MFFTTKVTYFYNLRPLKLASGSKSYFKRITLFNVYETFLQN